MILGKKDFSFIRKIGQKGGGPGELMHRPILSVLPDRLVISNVDRIVTYSKSGEFIGQKKLPFAYTYGVGYPLIPIADRYVGFEFFIEPESRFFGHKGNIYNSDIKLIANFYKLMSVDWQQTQKRYNYKFPDRLPAFFGFKADEEKMHIITYEKKGGMYKVLTLDSRGNLLNSAFVFPKAPYELIFGSFGRYNREFDIFQDRIYDILYNFEKDMYEVRVTNIQ